MITAENASAILEYPYSQTQRSFNEGTFPLIIMGGRWSGTPQEQMSDLSRVCGAGFTHVSSYYTESLIDSYNTLDAMVDKAVEFSSVLREHCPSLGIVVGVPRRWIYEKRTDHISKYAAALKDKGVDVSFWYSDEMIYQMVEKGLTVSEAVQRMNNAVTAVAEVSGARYIRSEPGAYTTLTRSILTELAKPDCWASIKSFDEYVISKKGSLTASGLTNILSTLKSLKDRGNTVFPICEINEVNGILPTEEELATILVNLMMNGADGLLFYEERRTTPEILESLAKINGLLRYLDNIGIDNFVKRTENGVTVWEASLPGRVVKVVFNSVVDNYNVDSVVKQEAKVVWPPSKNILDISDLGYMKILVVQE